jgi:hypothetical protein
MAAVLGDHETVRNLLFEAFRQRFYAIDVALPFDSYRSPTLVHLGFPGVPIRPIGYCFAYALHFRHWTPYPPFQQSTAIIVP